MNLDRPRTVLHVHAVLVQAITFALRPTAAYRALELDVPAAWLGVIGATFAVVPLVLAIPSGQAVDRYGERRVMCLGAALLVLCALLFTFTASTVGGLVVATMVLGLGHLCSVIGQQAMVAAATAPDGYDRAFGRYTFATSAGQAIGPVLIVAFGGRGAIPDTGSVFSWAIALAVVLVALSWALPHGHATRTAGDAEPASVRQLLRRPGLARALTVSCVVLAAVDITLVYLPALGNDRGIPAGAIGVLLGLRAAASMASRLSLGRLVGALGRHRVLVMSIAMSACSLALVVVPMPLWALGVAVVVLGLGLGAGQPLTMSWLAEATPAGSHGRAMSLRLTGNRLGQVLVPSAAGALAVTAGAGGVLLLTAAGLAAVGVTARRLHGPPG